MNKITKEWCEQNIFLDRRDELLLDCAEAYNCFPVVIAEVQFELPCSDGLIALADEIRAREGGYPPLSESETGWYNFYTGINDFTKTHMDNCISFSVNDESAPDDWSNYDIPLDEAEQLAVFDRLNELCMEHYGRGCEAFLEESRREFIGERS